MGRAAYSVVVLPECHCMEKKTREMLERFVQAGGHVIAVGELPSVSIDKEETDQETEAAWKALTAHANVVCLNGSRERFLTAAEAISGKQAVWRFWRETENPSSVCADRMRQVLFTCLQPIRAQSL